MRAIYRTSFELRAASPTQDLFRGFAEAVWRWVYDRRDLGLCFREEKIAGTCTLPQVTINDRYRVESLHVESKGLRAWGLVFAHPEAFNQDLTWVSELVLSKEPDGKHYFSFSQLVGRHDGGIAPLHRTPGRPRIIKTLVKDFVAYSGGIRLFSHPFPLRLKEDQIAHFIRILELPKRIHPVVFVSIHEQSSRPLINVAELADHLSGLAHVIVAENAAVAGMLSSKMPHWLTCFDGAVRVYWPGFRRAAQPVQHPLWTAQDLADEVDFDSGRFADKILASIAEVSVYSVPPYFYSWERLQSLDRKRIIAEAKDNKDWQALAQELDKENSAKEAALAQVRLQLQQINEDLFKERQLTAAYRQALEDRKAGKTAANEEQLPVATVAEAIDRVKQRYAGQIVFALNNKSDSKTPFREPGEVFTALEWLATFYVEARTGRQRCPRLDHELAQTLPGWDYRARQSDGTVGQNPEWYRCTWEGRRYEIEEHIGFGASKRPEETIRIAFAWDSGRKTVVVGYVGQHQRNTKS